MSKDVTINSELRYRKFFFILLGATTVFRLFYVQWIELAPDEAYYFTWSRNLQWGYYDHPPMVAFLIRLFTAIGGRGEFGVRLGWVVIGALLTYLVYKLGRNIFGNERAGFFSALLLNGMLLASAGAIIVTPDGPQVLFWGLAVYSVYKAVSAKRSYWWSLSGICFGLGLLSKYTMVLFAPCIFFFLLSTQEGRKWLLRKEPYLALFLGLMVFSPVIFWNAQNQWISFRYQMAHGLELKKAMGLRYFAEYWVGQAGLVSPFLFLAFLWGMVKSGIEGFRLKDQRLLLLFWTSAPILVFFGCTSLRTKVEGNWPACAYFSAGLALAGLAAAQWGEWKKSKRMLAWVMAGSAFMFTALAHLQPLYPFIPITAQRDPTSQLHGWRMLGEKLQEVARTMNPGSTLFLLTPRHQLVGEGMFYTQERFPIYQWDAPWRINHLSEKNSPPIGSQAIFFSEEGNELPPGIAPLFEGCEKLEPLVIRRESSVVRTHPMWKCYGFKGLQ